MDDLLSTSFLMAVDEAPPEYLLIMSYSRRHLNFKIATYSVLLTISYLVLEFELLFL